MTKGHFYISAGLWYFLISKHKQMAFSPFFFLQESLQYYDKYFEVTVSHIKGEKKKSLSIHYLLGTNGSIINNI